VTRGDRDPRLPADEYAAKPTILRFWHEDGEWFLDGVDHEGRYSEACWSYDHRADAWEDIPTFYESYIRPHVIEPLETVGLPDLTQQELLVLRGALARQREHLGHVQSTPYVEDMLTTNRSLTTAVDEALITLGWTQPDG